MKRQSVTSLYMRESLPIEVRYKRYAEKGRDMMSRPDL